VNARVIHNIGKGDDNKIVSNRRDIKRIVIGIIVDKTPSLGFGT